MSILVQVMAWWYWCMCVKEGADTSLWSKTYETQLFTCDNDANLSVYTKHIQCLTFKKSVFCIFILKMMWESQNYVYLCSGTAMGTWFQSCTNCMCVRVYFVELSFIELHQSFLNYCSIKFKIFIASCAYKVHETIVRRGSKETKH